MMISPHFSLEELTKSEIATRLGLDNTPGVDEITNLTRLCTGYLEPARSQVGPIETTSAFRSVPVNFAVHGSATSAHPRGRAHDGRAVNLSLLEYMDWWVNKSGLPFDQVIFEFGGWIHVGISEIGDVPRKEALMIFTLPGNTNTGYLPFDPKRISIDGKFLG
jgi:zinc D-Ala-D-Ala carboxypeptidase